MPIYEYDFIVEREECSKVLNVIRGKEKLGAQNFCLSIGLRDILGCKKYSLQF